MQKIFRLTGLVFIDGLLINLSYIFAFLLRFNFATESTVFSTYFEVYLNFWFLLTIVKIAVFSLCGLYRTLWRFAGAQDVFRILIAAFGANLIASLVLLMFHGELERSLMILPFLFDLLLVGCVRLLYRTAAGIVGQRRLAASSDETHRVMIVGAGYGAAAIIKEMRVYTKEMMALPVVAVDDNRSRVGSRISGIKIAGTRRDIPRLVRRYKVDEIYITLPSANKKEMEVILAECAKTNCKVKNLPSLHELAGGKISISKPRDIEIEDLLGRETVEVSTKELTSCFKGRIVLVTGAGGAVGSEICRQVGRYLPRKIIALDVAEKGIYELQFELKRLYPEVEIQSVVCSVTEAGQVREIFEKNKPHIVIHAASHKNVMLMEENPKEAVKNNVFGTLTLVNACEEFAAERFLLISSDKAMRPTEVTGAVARITEMIVELKSTISKTQYTAIRLGNMIGCEESIIPLIKSQIEHGGPVTVSHPDAVRHFMHLQPAVQLVLQAAAISQGGEVFAVKLGKAVRIMDLAENIIKMFGYKPYDEIQISVVGLKPGERLYEELMPDKDHLVPTKSEHIYIVENETLNDFEVNRRIGILWESVKHNDNAQIKKDLEGLIPEYKPRKR